MLCRIYPCVVQPDRFCPLSSHLTNILAEVTSPHLSLTKDLYSSFLDIFVFPSSLNMVTDYLFNQEKNVDIVQNRNKTDGKEHQRA